MVEHLSYLSQSIGIWILVYSGTLRIFYIFFSASTELNPFLPIIEDNWSYLSQDIGILIFVYTLQAISDLKLGNL
jgi:hypothetical protein